MPKIIEVSKCCRADLVEDLKDNPRDHHDPIEIYTCSKCKKECEVEEVCEDCRGTGVVFENEYEKGQLVGVGTVDKECLCQRFDGSDFTGATEGDR